MKIISFYLIPEEQHIYLKGFQIKQRMLSISVPSSVYKAILCVHFNDT